MGGDHGPATIVPAALEVLEQYADLSLILVGDEQVLRSELGIRAAGGHDRVQIRHASQKVEMDDSPALALRNKKDSSMRVAIDLVKEGTVAACVSAGNTGALMATARFVLKMLPGVDRPAICCEMPGIHGNSHLLDLGANVDSSPEQLVQFAVMGAALTTAIENKSNPSVALLNIGEEDIKGDDRVKQAALLLSRSPLNYVGFVEGNDIWDGEVDVIVCDGFVGNVALKASEGVAHMLMRFAKEEFMRTPLKRVSALLAKPALNALRRRIDPGRYNGASLLGLRGIVVKSHGNADASSFAHAIGVAIAEVQRNVPRMISSQLEQMLEKRQVV
jgi:phosphate acyltransferase